MYRRAAKRRDADLHLDSVGLAIDDARKLVRAINWEYLSRLEAGSSDLLPVNSHRCQWRGLDLKARERLAAFQLLLITAPCGCESHRARVTPETVDFARCTLTAMWHIAHRADQGLLLLGIAPSEGPSIKRIPVTDLDQLAVKGAASVRPRWELDAGFWDALLAATLGPDDRLWYDLQIHSWQRLGSELLGVQQDAAGSCWARH